ncbi:hypothetical protein [Enterococcus sp. DIV0660C]|uniref:hypothetical protein n=1 Tax=Enterococcus sp. DIV0660C TaxID=2230880 RepID=UPI001A8C636F|nr:hypothetical protein [Enterococcus sp. DIV0660C]MBO0432498.1 hypothetical protein [Enterococcus sp. DIV0660C]
MESIVIDRITKSFGNHKVLKGISLTIKQGEIFVLLGEMAQVNQRWTTLSKASSGTAKILGIAVQNEAAEVREKINQ